MCKSCGRQFIGDHALSYKGFHSSLTQKILLMPVRGIGIRDISIIENVSVKKVLSVPVNSNRIITPKQQHYDSLEVDEFRTYVGSKKRKVWLIYAYPQGKRIKIYIFFNHQIINMLQITHFETLLILLKYRK